MNSEERRRARRARREKERELKRRKRLENCTLESVASLQSLYEASEKAANGVRWKASVQRYHLDAIGNAAKTRADILAGRNIHKGFVHFTVFERGKLRHIASVRFSERVVQKSINQNALMPAMKDSLIYDNSANIKGKGTDFAVKRMVKHLADHYRRHGAEGYILLGDYKNFFGSIPHEGAKELVRKFLDDEGLIALACSQIDNPDGEFGLPLGSEINQTIAVTYQSAIDHFVLECCGVEAYGRYMDDFYAIDASKERLQMVLGCIEAKSADIGLTLNKNKTHIVKLTHGFTYLKRKFSYGEHGRVIIRPVRKSITRMRRRMKRQAKLVEAGRMTYPQALQSYMSWRGFVSKMDAHEVVSRMDALFDDLFERYR